MSKINLGFISIILFFSCKNEKKDIELEIINNQLYTYKSNDDFDTLNIVRYKILNNSDNFFYFNSIITNLKNKPGIFIKKSNRFFRVYDTLNKEIEYNYSVIHDSDSIEVNDNLFLFNYFNANENNFFLKPKETLFFEIPVRFVANKNWENEGSFHARIDSKKNLYSKLFLISDSTNFKKNLPTKTLIEIERNNVKVFHGIIECKNKVPLKILD